MTIEQFLLFWNRHNIHIIEGLLAIIVVLSLLQAYRLFFGKKSGSDNENASGSGLDAAQLEKTLQKILAAQQGGKHDGHGRTSNDDVSMEVDMNEVDAALGEDKDEAKATPTAASGEADAKIVQELAALKQSLAERQKTIETLQEQVKKAAEAPVAAAVEAVAPGMSAAEKNAFDEKIRDLEARLAEYEIISEDIADLSKYKDENESLKAQVDSLRSSGGAAPATPAEEAPAAPVAAAEPAPSVEPEPTTTPEEPAAAAAATTSSEAMSEADLAAIVNDIKPAPSEEPATDLIDDELMKEFAMAVEGQKALEGAAEKAGPGDQATKKSDDTEKLMDEFENFVNKKS
ncbi:hypothetical protein D3C87_301360 [compost metagenome]